MIEHCFSTDPDGTVRCFGYTWEEARDNHNDMLLLRPWYYALSNDILNLDQNDTNPVNSFVKYGHYIPKLVNFNGEHLLMIKDNCDKFFLVIKDNELLGIFHEVRFNNPRDAYSKEHIATQTIFLMLSWLIEQDLSNKKITHFDCISFTLRVLDLVGLGIVSIKGVTPQDSKICLKSYRLLKSPGMFSSALETKKIKEFFNRSHKAAEKNSSLIAKAYKYCEKFNEYHNLETFARHTRSKNYTSYIPRELYKSISFKLSKALKESGKELQMPYCDQGLKEILPNDILNIITKEQFLKEMLETYQLVALDNGDKKVLVSFNDFSFYESLVKEYGRGWGFGNFMRSKEYIYQTMSEIASQNIHLLQAIQKIRNTPRPKIAAATV